MAAAAPISLVGLLLWQAGGISSTPVPRAGNPRPQTVQAFDRYIRLTESALDARLRGPGDFLWTRTGEMRPQLLQGRVVCAPRNRSGDVKVPYGLIHDWVGAVFIPGVSLADVLSLVQDYDNDKKTYRHEVLDSHTIARDGNDFRVYLRLLKRKVITVVLDTEHEVHYRRLDDHRWRSKSYSTRIQEIGDPRRAGVRPGSRDHGFLWRLNSYWTFVEKDGGVYVECQAISLSRSVPASLAWLLDPIVRSLPREALVSTLRSTRAALAGPDRVAPTPSGLPPH